MKKLLTVAILAVAAVGGVAVAKAPRPARNVSDAQVKAVIDARLHEMLVRLNGERAP